MTISLNATLYVALAFYTVGTIAALLSLFTHEKWTRNAGLAAMITGFASHTFWIGTICTITGHPPITNLAEAASFVAWVLFVIELALFLRYRVQAASFFVYPLVLILLTISAVAREPFAKLSPGLRSNMFTAHILSTTLGVAGLLIGLAFSYLAYVQDRALREKTRGRLWEWIPSLNVCKTVSYRALSIGFSIYTVGIITGVLWSYRTNVGLMEPRTKQIGAVVAWVLFAVLLQSTISGTLRGRRTVAISVCALAAILVAILGISHG